MIMKGMIYEPFGVPKLAFGDMIISLGVTIAAGIPSFRKFTSFPMMFSPILLIVINHNKLIIAIVCGFTLKRVRDMTRTYSQKHRTDKYSEHSSIIWPEWLSVRLRTKWFWVRVQLQIGMCYFRKRSGNYNSQFEL